MMRPVTAPLFVCIFATAWLCALSNWSDAEASHVYVPGSSFEVGSSPSDAWAGMRAGFGNCPLAELSRRAHDLFRFLAASFLETKKHTFGANCRARVVDSGFFSFLVHGELHFPQRGEAAARSEFYLLLRALYLPMRTNRTGSGSFCGQHRMPGCPTKTTCNTLKLPF